jgi:hypothetical protein
MCSVDARLKLGRIEVLLLHGANRTCHICDAIARKGGRGNGWLVVLRRGAPVAARPGTDKRITPGQRATDWHRRRGRKALRLRAARKGLGREHTQLRNAQGNARLEQFAVKVVAFKQHDAAKTPSVSR